MNNIETLTGQGFESRSFNNNNTIPPKTVDQTGNNNNFGESLNDKIISELRKSGIEDDVIAANVEIVADLEFDPITNEVTETPITDALGFRYTRFGKQAKGTEYAALFIGEDGEVWQGKIYGENADKWLTAHEDQGKRSGLYRAPKGIGDKPYLPTIPKRIQKAIAAKYGLEPPGEGEKFWEWILNHPEIPVIVTEGAKKALAVISQGKVAIALYGCQCGVDKGVIKEALRPYIKERKIYIGFDQDTSQKTSQKVRRAGYKMARALWRISHIQPCLMTWDGYQGKGLDDLIANNISLFNKAFEEAKPVDIFGNDLSKYISLKVNHRYLPNDLFFPDYAKVIGLLSAKGTNKTGCLAAKIQEAINKGIRVIVIVHREQLAKELARRFGIPYRTVIKEYAEGSINGYALCIDSLHPNANPRFNVEEWHDCWVIIDECEQVLWHGLNSYTCDKNRVNILETFSQLLNVASKIFLSDADLSRFSVDYVLNSLEEKTKPYIIKNEWKPDNKQATFYDKPKDLLSIIINNVTKGETAFIATGSQKDKSQWGTINLEKALNDYFPDKRILRIDRETVADPNHPAYGCIDKLNQITLKYDIVICSPVIETGVSIDNRHFQGVYAFGTGTQTVNAFCQALERVRDNVPRYIWATEYSTINKIGNGSDNYCSLLKSNDKNFSQNYGQLSLADQLIAIDRNDSEDGSLQNTPINATTWAKMGAYFNYGFANYLNQIREKLKDEGYQFDDFLCSVGGSDSVKEKMKAIKEQSIFAHCQAVASAELLEPSEYELIKEKRAKTEKERLSEKKTAIANRYATKEVDPDLVRADDDGWYGQLQLHYFLTMGRQFLIARDREKVERITNDGKVFSPDLNRVTLSAKIRAFEAINIQQFLEPGATFTSEGLTSWFEKCKAGRQDIKTYTGQGLSIEKDTPISFAQRLLGTMGLKMICIGQKRIDGKPTRIYAAANPNPDGREEIFLRWFDKDSIKFSESDSTVTPPTINKENILLEGGVTPDDFPKNPLESAFEVGSLVSGFNEDCVYLVVKMNGVIAHLVQPDFPDWPEGFTLEVNVRELRLVA